MTCPGVKFRLCCLNKPIKRKLKNNIDYRWLISHFFQMMWQSILMHFLTGRLCSLLSSQSKNGVARNQNYAFRQLIETLLIICNLWNSIWILCIKICFNLLIKFQYRLNYLYNFTSSDAIISASQRKELLKCILMGQYRQLW